jgi:hypothetical protein
MSHSADHQRLFYRLAAVCLLLISAAPAFANVPMAFVIPLTKYAYLWAVPIAMVIEAVAIRWIFKFTWQRSAIASVAVNVATLLLGIVIYLPVAMLLYPNLAPAIIELTGGGEDVERAATLLGMSIIDTTLEIALLALIFKAKMMWSRAVLFLVANVATAGILFGILSLEASREREPERLSVEEVARIEQDFAVEIEFLRGILKELPDRMRPKEHFPSANEFDPEWVRLKKVEAEAFRFRKLLIYGRGSSAILQRFDLPGSRRLYAEHSAANLEVKKYLINETIGIYSYRLSRKVNSDTYKVFGWFKSLD